jgi:hypothetical protein
LIVCAVAALAACAKQSAAPQAAKATPQQGTIKGTVAETIHSGGFTYVRLKTASGESWMVTGPVDVKVGSDVSVKTSMTVDNFESKSLNRTFPHMIFGSIEGATPLAGAADHAEAMASQAATDTASTKVEKAEGSDARTVAEIWATKSALKDRRVVVRGKVVKFLPSIMGKNWLHVRDGSGTRAKGDDDIAVISDDTTTVGSIVTVTGTVRLDKDFGAGYQYPVIIEDAKLK